MSAMQRSGDEGATSAASVASAARAGGVQVGRRRLRAAIGLAIGGAVRGASEEVLARPAAEVLEAMPWQGPSPDPSVLDAVTFLAWL